MGRQRNIFFSENCDRAAKELGGYIEIDQTLDAVWDVLINNPYALPKCESDWYSARFIVTIKIENIPALVWCIVIGDDGDITIDHVEQFEAY